MRSDRLVRNSRRHDQHWPPASHQRDFGEIAPRVGNLLAGLAANDQVHAAALLRDHIGAHDIGCYEAVPLMRDLAALESLLEGALGGGGGIVAGFLQPVDDLLGDFRRKLPVNRQVGSKMQPDYVGASCARYLEDWLQRGRGVLPRGHIDQNRLD